MRINEKMVTTKEELLNIIKEGTNPLDYVIEESDIDLITESITIEGNDEDSYYEESAEILFKSIVYYVLKTENEEKTLKRCKKVFMNGKENYEELKNMLSSVESAKVLFIPIDIASENTRKDIFDKLEERLSKI